MSEKAKSAVDKLREQAKRKADNHLAEGEVTGHFHDAIGNGVAVYDLPGGELGGVALLEAPEGATIMHQEHGTIKVAPGTYVKEPVREFDPFRESIRNVLD